MKNSEITQIALLTAIALIFGYIESLFPLPTAVPGIKLGLSNIVIIFAVLRLGKKQSFLILILKVLVSSLLFSGVMSLAYAAAGGLCALFAMLAARRFSLGIIGISTAGGVFHNIGQIAAACIVLSSYAPVYYLPFLIPAGVLCGILTGIVCKMVLKRV